MPIDLIAFEGNIYPKFQSDGNAARFCLPFAREVCKGDGLDIGTGKEEWALPGATIIDPKIGDNGYHATNLPEGKQWDFIFSSHCLEHLDDWVGVLDYWYDCLKRGGVLFLYLPDFSQVYWRSWNNRKHKSVFMPEIIHEYMLTKYIKVTTSSIDLNNSFCSMGEK